MYILMAEEKNAGINVIEWAKKANEYGAEGYF